MTSPISFSTATSPIPLRQLDTNFSLPITLGSTRISLGGAVNTLVGVDIIGNAATATNMPWSGLTGGVPIWNQNTTGNARNITGNLSVSSLNSGVNASSTTYWRGDGVWAPIPSGQVPPTWIDYVSDWCTPPHLLTSISDGDVWQYTYAGGVVRYRLVPSGSVQDSFYTTFTGGVLSGHLVDRGMTV